MSREKCYNRRDTSLTFVNGDDVLDFLCSDFKSLRAKMSCGHAVTPMSLTHWCRRLLDKGECRFVCGQTGCDVEWPFKEVCKMALLTPEEIKYFEKKMFDNATKNDFRVSISVPLETLRNCPDIVFEDVKGVTGCPSVRACPTCGVLLGHKKNLCKNTVCPRCKKEFCFVCLKLTAECQKLNPSSYYNECSTGVAPRQTSIPVWRRK